MTEITAKNGRHMYCVDPKTGLQIEHVKACDPDLGWVETWSTYPAHPEHPSLWMEDGKTVEKPVMLMNLNDPVTGERTFMTRVHYIDYDVVDKHTGLVLFEVRRKQTGIDGGCTCTCTNGCKSSTCDKL